MFQGVVAALVLELLKPGALAQAKTPQVHRIDDVLTADDGVDGDWDDQGSRLANLGDQATLQLSTSYPRARCESSVMLKSRPSVGTKRKARSIETASLSGKPRPRKVMP